MTSASASGGTPPQRDVYREGEGNGAGSRQIGVATPPRRCAPTVRCAGEGGRAVLNGLEEPMPHFEEFYADKLRGSLGVSDAEAVLDLRGAAREQAAASLQDMLERSRFGQAKSVAVRLDPPPEGGGETLFQPIGKALL